MNVELMLLMICVALACCQSTISIRDDTERLNEYFEEVKTEIISVRQLLMTQQKAVLEYENA